MASKKSLIRSACIILGSFILAFAAMAWFRYDIAAQAARAQLRKIELNRQSNLAPTLAILRNDAERASVYERRLAGLLPQKDALIDFRNFLEALAVQRRVTTNFAFQGVGSGLGQGDLASIPFSLEISGSLANIQGLLEDIEVKPRSYLLALEDFDLSAVADGYRANFRGKLFYKESTTQ